MLQIETILKQLAAIRPVFHSEHDFKFAIAWTIQTLFPSARVRLEVNIGEIDKKEYIDIGIRNEDQFWALELKYKTRDMVILSDDETFRLSNHGAQDCGRYDYIKDITRLERFTGKPNTTGYAVMLTNDDSYWRATNNSLTVDSDFRIHEGRTLQGILKWGAGASDGTMKGRTAPLILKNAYPLHWADYSELPENGPNKFRYLLLKI